MIKYINLQTALCPVCNQMKDVKNAFPLKIFKCTPTHLKEAHNIDITPISDIIEEILDLTKRNSHDTDKKHRITRKQILEYARLQIKPNLNRLKEFIKTK